MRSYKMYKLLKSFDGEIRNVLFDGKNTIPFDPDNTDYQTYLAWVALGNTPQPADDQLTA